MTALINRAVHRITTVAAGLAALALWHDLAQIGGAL
jgi:hypothetical protein